MQDILLKIAATINTYLSDYILIFLLVGVGLFYSIRTRFVQVRCFGEGMKKTFGNLSLKGGKQEAGMSSFQALATAIAAPLSLWWPMTTVACLFTRKPRSNPTVF